MTTLEAKQIGHSRKQHGALGRDTHEVLMWKHGNDTSERLVHGSVLIDESEVSSHQSSNCYNYYTTKEVGKHNLRLVAPS